MELSYMVAAAATTTTTAATTTTITASASDRNLIDLDENARRDIATMDSWATESGVQRAEGFQLTATNPEGEGPVDVGVVTTADLTAGSPVLFVPHQMILSAQKAKQEFGTVEEAETLFAKLDVSSMDRDRFYLFLKVLVEYERGQQSPWYPWLDALPRYYSNGASMTHFCCSNCLPPLVGNLAMEERKRFRQFYKALDFVTFLTVETKGHKTLAKWYDIFKPKGGDQDCYTMPTVRSYLFSLSLSPSLSFSLSPSLSFSLFRVLFFFGRTQGT